MDTNTLFNIYQSYTLTKVSEFNKQTLVALYAQNEQLIKLNEELARSNRTTEQILRNQIKEIELQEKRRYYKNMTFNLSRAVTLIEDEENVNMRIFASGLFLSPICDMAKDAVQELEEIADKEYAQNIVQRVNALSKNNENNKDSYIHSSWAVLLSTKSIIDDDIAKKIKDKKKEIKLITSQKEEIYQKKIKKAQNEKKASEGCFGCLRNTVFFLIIIIVGTIYTHDYDATKGAIILLIPALLLLIGAYAEKKPGWFKISDNKEPSKKKNEDSEEEILEKKLESLSDELANLQQEETRLTTQYNEHLQNVTADCPNWENKLNEIASIIPHEEKKDHRDPLLFEAAKLIIKKKKVSTSLIQRKLAIGYNRAERIMHELEEVGIVGIAKDSKTKIVLCDSEEELLEILSN